jgi:hypothetical protein
MKTRLAILLGVIAFGSLVYASLAHAEGPSGKKDAGAPAVAHSYDAAVMRVQGRCHAAPRKFPPRMMATVLRHMRVRATITDEDMRLVLFYMSQ